MNEPTPKIKERLISIDVLRGFAMFLILAYNIGGAPVIQTFIRLFAPNIRDFIQAIGAMSVMWLIMYWMYVKKTFIKI